MLLHRASSLSMRSSRGIGRHYVVRRGQGQRLPSWGHQTLRVSKLLLGAISTGGVEIGTQRTQLLLIQKVLGLLAMAFRALVSHSSLDASLTWACCVTGTTIE